MLKKFNLSFSGTNLLFALKRLGCAVKLVVSAAQRPGRVYFSFRNVHRVCWKPVRWFVTFITFGGICKCLFQMSKHFVSAVFSEHVHKFKQQMTVFCTFKKFPKSFVDRDDGAPTPAMTFNNDLKTQRNRHLLVGMFKSILTFRQKMLPSFFLDDFFHSLHLQENAPCKSQKTAFANIGPIVVRRQNNWHSEFCLYTIHVIPFICHARLVKISATASVTFLPQDLKRPVVVVSTDGHTVSWLKSECPAVCVDACSVVHGRPSVSVKHDAKQSVLLVAPGVDVQQCVT